MSDFTFEEVMANLTKQERDIIEEEMERQRDYGYESGRDYGYDTGYDSGYDSGFESGWVQGRGDE